MKVEGYQLLECLAVCLLFTAMLGFGGATLSKSVGRYRLECSAQSLAAQLETLRAAAVSRKAPLSVSISDCRSKYGFGPRNARAAIWNSLPIGVSVVDQPSRPVTFYSRGNAVPAGSYHLSNAVGQCKVVVSPTGRIRCENLS
jgi:Tfp pilus assembly protein FimT